MVSSVAVGASSFGAYFVEVTRYNQTFSTDGNPKIEFYKQFHRCSIKSTCNYVGICTETHNVTWYSKETDVPFNKNWFRVWKRVISKGHGTSVTFIFQQ